MSQLIAEFEPSHATTFWGITFNYQVEVMWSVPYKCIKDIAMENNEQY